MYESHSHTPLCNHAIGNPTEYAAVASRRGLKGLIVTCHNPMPGNFSARVRMREDQFDEYVELVQQTAAEYLRSTNRTILFVEPGAATTAGAGGVQ